MGTDVPTLLDQYAFFLFAFIFGCMVVSTATSYFEAEDQVAPDMHAAWLFGVWCLYHVYFVILIRKKLRHRESMLLVRPEPPRKAYIIKDGQTLGELAKAGVPVDTEPARRRRPSDNRVADRGEDGASDGARKLNAATKKHGWVSSDTEN